jgi:TPR repeat protein
MKATLFALFVGLLMVGCGAQKVSYDNEEILELIGPISPAEFDRTKKLAEAGDMAAQVRLSLLYSVGAGVPQDHKEAFKWSLKAAEQGNAGSQFGVGVSYPAGQGVVEDYVTSFAWCSVAQANGNKAARLLLKKLKIDMTKQQVAVGQALAKQIFERIENKDHESPVNRGVD